MTDGTFDVHDEIARENAMHVAIAERDRQRGRRLTDTEQVLNLIAGLGEHDSDCPAKVEQVRIRTRMGQECTCGADRFRAKFGPGKHTP